MPGRLEWHTVTHISQLSNYVITKEGKKTLQIVFPKRPFWKRSSPSGTYVIRSGAQSIRKGWGGAGFIFKNVYVKEPRGNKKGVFKRFTVSPHVLCKMQQTVRSMELPGDCVYMGKIQ